MTYPYCMTLMYYERTRHFSCPAVFIYIDLLKVLLYISIDVQQYCISSIKYQVINSN